MLYLLFISFNKEKFVMMNIWNIYYLDSLRYVKIIKLVEKLIILC